MEDFAVTCPLVPNVPHLRSGSYTSPRAFGLGFLQTPPHDDALALLLAFGSSYTWHRDFHPTRSVSCLAHTSAFNRRRRRSVATQSWTSPGQPLRDQLESIARRYLRVQVYGQPILVSAGKVSPLSNMMEIGIGFSASGSAFIAPESNGRVFLKSPTGSIQCPSAGMITFRITIYCSLVLKNTAK